MSESSSESAAQPEIKERLSADWQWLAGRGIRLSQWGPDPVSGKVRVYLQRYSDEARQVLENRYGKTSSSTRNPAYGVPASAIMNEREALRCHGVTLPRESYMAASSFGASAPQIDRMPATERLVLGVLCPL